jgi:hypothetical protein
LQRWPQLRFEVLAPLLVEPTMQMAVARWALDAPLKP